MSRLSTIRWTPLLFLAATGLLLAAGLWWRTRTPPQPLFPLARAALALDDQWRRGELVLNVAAPPLGLPAFAHWRPVSAQGSRLDVGVPGPPIDLPWAGAGVARVEEAPAVVDTFGDPARGALVVVAAVGDAAIFGRHGGHFESEWSRYEFDAGERRLLVWRRGPMAFALVTDRPIEAATAWIPAPLAAEGRYLPAGAGSADPGRASQ